ncbi:MAG: outer membrane lipoprotein-sorting protein [Vicinamibacteria bacterium]
MKTRPLATTLALASCLAPLTLGLGNDQEGQALAQAVHERPDGRDAAVKSTMFLEEEGHKARVRELFMYRLERGEGELRSFIRFTAPAQIDGVSLLTHDEAGATSQQWLYLPELGKTRRIAASGNGGRFVGSDYFYEDLQDREVALDEHRYLGEKDLDGTICAVLESIPRESKNSVYSKRVAWIHRDSQIPLQILFYDSNAESPVKIFRVHKIEKMQGYWTVMDSTMRDVKTGHKTRIVVRKIRYDLALPEELFGVGGLEDPNWEKKYRPQ